MQPAMSAQCVVTMPAHFDSSVPLLEWFVNVVGKKVILSLKGAHLYKFNLFLDVEYPVN